MICQQAATEDRENALLAAREEAAQQLQRAQEAAAAAATQLAEAQAAAKAEAGRLAADRVELDKQLKVAQVRVGARRCNACSCVWLHFRNSPAFCRLREGTPAASPLVGMTPHAWLSGVLVVLVCL